ncbi:MAG: GNAT family N-acetyltransferase [Phycisphaerales bacterium]
MRQAQPGDFDQIIEMGRLIYSDIATWSPKHLESHQQIFPEGQLVAVDQDTGKLVGSSASLIVLWDDYDLTDSWHDFTDGGMFTNHDTEGRTLYGADVMVHPHHQGRGIGKIIYKARRDLTRCLGLRRIRAGARLRNYGKYKDQMTPEDYVLKIISGEMGDPTLSFQVKQGFRILGVVRDYLRNDPESCGHAAVIEWVNHQVAERKDTYGRDPKFAKHRKPPDKPTTGG